MPGSNTEEAHHLAHLHTPKGSKTTVYKIHRERSKLLDVRGKRNLKKKKSLVVRKLLRNYAAVYFRSSATGNNHYYYSMGFLGRGT